MTDVMTMVVLCTMEDEARFREIIQGAIDRGEVSLFPDFRLPASSEHTVIDLSDDDGDDSDDDDDDGSSVGGSDAEVQPTSKAGKLGAASKGARSRAGAGAASATKGGKTKKGVKRVRVPRSCGMPFAQLVRSTLYGSRASFDSVCDRTCRPWTSLLKRQ